MYLEIVVFRLKQQSLAYHLAYHMIIEQPKTHFVQLTQLFFIIWQRNSYVVVKRLLMAILFYI